MSKSRRTILLWYRSENGWLAMFFVFIEFVALTNIFLFGYKMKINRFEDIDAWKESRKLVNTQAERLSSLPHIQGRCRRAIVDYARQYLTPKMG